MDWGSRLRNPATWVAFLALVSLVLQKVGVGLPEGTYNEIATGVLNFLVLLGILNNPTNGKWFLDEVKQAPSKE